MKTRIECIAVHWHILRVWLAIRLINLAIKIMPSPSVEQEMANAAWVKFKLWMVGK